METSEYQFIKNNIQYIPFAYFVFMLYIYTYMVMMLFHISLNAYFKQCNSDDMLADCNPRY